MKLRTSLIYFCLVAGLAAVIFDLYSPGYKREDLPMLAESVLKKCAGESYKPSCYDTEIPKLMEDISMEDAFAVTKLVQQQDSGYWFCHVLGHNISAREAAKDPSRWKDVITRCPSGTCSNGCIHGAFQERFRTDVLTDTELEEAMPDLQDVCEPRGEWKPTGLEQASCYHALGHLLMYVTAADIRKSNEICRRIAIKPDGRNFLQTCHEGNFMQIYQPLEAEDFDLVKNIAPQSAKSAFAFCSRFGTEEEGACRRESWPLSRQEILTAPGLVKFCGYFKTSDLIQKCYNAMFYVIPVQLQFNQDQIVALCKNLPKEYRGQCFANSASRFIETDYQLAGKAVTFCRIAEQYGLAEQCYRELDFYSTFNFHPGSPEAAGLCNEIPPIYRQNCSR